MKTNELKAIVDDILKVFPKFFDDFKNWEYGNGTDAGKDFKRIYNKAKRLKMENNNGN